MEKDTRFAMLVIKHNHFPYDQTRKYISKRKSNKISPVEYIVDLFANICPETKKFAIDSVQSGFKVIPFSRIFTVKEF